MPNPYSNPAFPNLPRVRQKNNYFCGPAVLTALLKFKNFEVGQDAVVDKANVADKIKSRGMLIEEIAKASRILAPELDFWYKRHSTLAELSLLINEHKHPAGIEWQGLFEFEDDEDEGDSDSDPGHYSIVTQIDLATNLVILSDPYKDYAGRDRRFTVLEFERRWWDITEIYDSVSHLNKEVDDYHAMFIVTEKNQEFPRSLGMELSA